MPEPFLTLGVDEQWEALQAAAANTGRPVHLLEKDIWVVWCLNTLFSAPFGGNLVFKGGTSLSKAFNIIERFSEDIDVTFDIRAIAPDLTGNQDEPLPPNPSQLKKWRATIEARLIEWVADVVMPHFQRELAESGLEASLRPADDCLFLDYHPLEAGSGYVSPTVRIEFGAKSTGEPAERRQVGCDAAASLPMLEFPIAHVPSLLPERTFWEKATAAHAYCRTGVMRGRNAYARHWHDLTKLAQAGVAARAASDRELGKAVARHKAVFFVEKDEAGPINYAEAIAGGLSLVPEGERSQRLRDDYEAMIADGLLPAPVDTFETMMAKCAEIERAINET